MLPGETIFSGAPETCSHCIRRVRLEVMRTSGWYVGTQCFCGPYTRETGYYGTKEEAQAALKRIKNGETKDLRK